jgi:hypothetical protein
LEESQRSWDTQPFDWSTCPSSRVTNPCDRDLQIRTSRAGWPDGVVKKYPQMHPKPNFDKFNNIAFSVEKIITKMRLSFLFKKIPKIKTTQLAKIRPIWSPWSRVTFVYFRPIKDLHIRTYVCTINN